MKNEIIITDPELDYSEFFRLFNYLNDKLPKYINKNLFNKNKYYAEIIDNNTNEILNKKYNKENALTIIKYLDKKWINFIKFIYDLFINGTVYETNLNFLKDVYFDYNIKQNDQSFHNFIKDKNYNEHVNDELKKYFNNSFKWFDEHYYNIHMPVVISINNKYYLVGGNRRISWLIHKGFKKIPIYLLTYTTYKNISTFNDFLI